MPPIVGLVKVGSAPRPRLAIIVSDTDENSPAAPGLPQTVKPDTNSSVCDMAALQSLDNVHQVAGNRTRERKRPKLLVQTVAAEKVSPFQNGGAQLEPTRCQAKPEGKPLRPRRVVPAPGASGLQPSAPQPPCQQEPSREDLAMRALIMQSHYTSVRLHICPNTKQCIPAEHPSCDLPEQPSTCTIAPSRTPSPELASACSSGWDAPSSQASGISSTTSLDAHLGDAISIQREPTCKLASRRSFALGTITVDTEVAQPQLVPQLAPLQPAAQPAAPARREQQHQQRNADVLERASAHAKAQHGWFSRCRGCAQMTGHEYTGSVGCPAAAGHHLRGIPFCAPCNQNLLDMDTEVRPSMEAQLVGIHSSWLGMGI